MKIKIKVIPNSSRNEIVGQLGDCLKVVVTAPPQAGKANEAVRELFSKELAINKKSIQISSGKSSFRKVIQVNASDEKKIMEKLKIVAKHK